MRTYTADEVDAMIGRALARERERAAQQQEPVAWTLTETLTKRETTARGYLWFSDPQNCMWTPLYTSPQPAQQEPVAWRVRFHYGTDGMQKRIGDWKLYSYSPTPEKDKEVEPLYTSPPAQRKPLTDEEIGNDPIFRAGVRFAESKHGIHAPTERGENK